MGPADNTGPIFRLRLSGVLHCPCVRVVVAVLVMRMLYFLISSSAAVPPFQIQQDEKELREGFSIASFNRGLSGPPLGPRRRHGNWSDVADEVEYSGARESGMSGEEETKGRRG